MRGIGRGAAIDPLDVRILRFYLQDQTLAPISARFRDPLAVIARRVGEDEEVVRHRLKRIQDSGFIEAWRLYVNPSLWGGGNLEIRLDVDPSARKSKLVAELRLVPGMTHVAVFYDSLVALLEYEDEATVPRQIELVRRLTEAPQDYVARDAFPECTIAMTSRDWDLVRALRKDPRAPYAELAAVAGVSARTAKVRLSRMLAAGVGFAWPTLNMRAPLDGVSVQLEVRYPGERKAQIDNAIATRLEAYHWHTLHLLPYRRDDLWPCGYHLIVPNLSVAREALEWARGIPGVAYARVHVYEDLVNFYDTYDEMLDRRLGRMPTARLRRPIHRKRHPSSSPRRS